MLTVDSIAPDRLRTFTRQEYDRLVLTGFFADERLELLQGMLVSMSPQGARHSTVIRRLTKLLVLAVGERAAVQIQAPLAASDDSEPEPDVAIVPSSDYLDDHPNRALLVIEVADSSLTKDRGPKGSLYGEMGVPEYWIVNLLDGVFEVYTNPGSNGYRSRVDVARDGSVSPTAFPDIVVEVGDIIS